MKILIATDSFKDCLTAKRVGENIKKGIALSSNSFNVKILPMADGGEGTVQSLVDATNGELVTCKVNDALNRKIDSFYGILGDKHTAIIEMAAASGIEQIKPEERNPWNTSTYGTGELIIHALNRKCERIIIGIGGSATNDGGVGMAQALGVRFLDKSGTPINSGGGALSEIEKIDITGMDKRIKDLELIVACDVTNPLTGNEGASFVYGPQKGADSVIVAKLDANLKHYAAKIKETFGTDVETVPGAGAAGGLGAGLMIFCNGRLEKGVDIVSRESGLLDKCKWADVVITGEGKIDSQTRYGKTPQGVADAAKKAGKPLIAVAGTLGEGYVDLYDSGFDIILSIVDGPMELSAALDKAPQLLRNAGLTIGNLLSISGIEI